MEDYGALIQSGMNLVPDLEKQLLARAQTTALGAQAEYQKAQAAEAAQKQSRFEQFQHDIHTFDGSPTSASNLIMRYPEYADELKKGWDVQDSAKKQSDLTSLGEIYSAATAGNWALAKKLAHARADAEKAAGYSDPQYDAAIEIMDKAAEGDPTQQKVVLNLIGTHLAAVTGPEHFGTVYGALKNKGDYTLGPGDVRMDDNGNIVGHSPVVKGDDGTLYDYNSVMGGGQTPPSSKGGDPSAVGMSPKIASVASTLSASLPAPVVAGFLGNFHVEGGYDGAQGDGGSASGIAQWHNDRAANFEKVIGKPVTEATPEEQARFVLHEMEHPEEAGMTVAQRDQIMAAKSPAQAAALIDKFYERSDGKARNGRMAAANAFANVQSGQAPQGGGPRVLLPGKPREAPSGYRWSADGKSLEVIPNGPADSSPKFRLLTSAEKAQRGLDTNQQYQIDTKSGQITAMGGQARQAKQIPQQVETKVQPMVDVRDTINRLQGSWDDQFGGHYMLGDNLNSLQGVFGNVGPTGMRDWWADFKSMDNQVRNQLFGSALTEHEKRAYEATTISPKMDPAQIKKNLARRQAIINAATSRQQNFLKKNGYDPEAVDALFQPLGNFGGPQAPASQNGWVTLPSGLKVRKIR